MSFQKGFVAFIQRFKNRFDSDRYFFTESIVKTTELPEVTIYSLSCGCFETINVFSVFERINEASYEVCKIFYQVSNDGAFLCTIGPKTKLSPNGIYFCMFRARQIRSNKKVVYKANKPKFAKEGCKVSKIIFEQNKISCLE